MKDQNSKPATTSHLAIAGPSLVFGKWSGHALNGDGSIRPLTKDEIRLVEKYHLIILAPKTQETPPA